MEYKLMIAGTEYSHSDIRSATIERPLFADLSIGNACEAVLTAVLRPKGEIPQMARIEPYVLEGGVWERLGVFYLDERHVSASGLMSIIAYDAMLMAEIVWEPDQSLNFPMPASAAAEEIAALMGVELDPRTVLGTACQVDYPANDYTLRNVLCYIAAAHGGNWIMTREGKLLLVPLVGSAPPETYYLVDEEGDALVFGGDRILV